MEDIPDWVELVVRARGGDAEAGGELLVRFTPLIRSTAARLTDPSLVDDVVQESFTVALRNLGALRTAEAFPSWLRLIVRKAAHASRRRTAPEPPGAVAHAAFTADGSDVASGRYDGSDVGAGDPSVAVVQREVVAAVHTALLAASDADRRLLALRYLAGWTNSELAELLGVSDGAVRKRLHDARRRLRPHLIHLRNEESSMTMFRSFLDAVHNADVAVPEALPLRRASDAPTATGLRVIDTVAPVRRGGTIEMVGPSGTGHLVLAFELLFRLGRTEHEIACIAVGGAGVALGSQSDLGHVVSEPGLPGPNAAVLWRQPSDADRAFAAGRRLAAGLAAEGLDVVLVADALTVSAVGADGLRSAAGLAGDGAVTVVAIRAGGHGDALPPALGLDTTVVFSAEQVALGLFPAVDPLASRSLLVRPAAVDAALDRLRAAAEIRSWFAQPMFIAAEFTGEDGTWIDPADAEADLADLVG